ncbi:MAG TPA: transcriptional regulator [Firmicutes bacterium]|nr:transcriptional regulator [Bacillota bacterium]
MPKAAPMIIDVPEMLFIAVDGEGDPNTAPAYADAVELLFGLSYTIKMSPKSGSAPEGYFEYVVPPLEGLWWGGGVDPESWVVTNKQGLSWTMMIRQPQFVTEAVFAWAQETLAKKKPELDLTKARLMSLAEGLCVQMMHIGPYDTEPASIQRMHAFAFEHGYRLDFSSDRKHHEIYLSDPRKTAPDKLKTVLRHPVAK